MSEEKERGMKGRRMISVERQWNFSIDCIVEEEEETWLQW